MKDHCSYHGELSGEEAAKRLLRNKHESCYLTRYSKNKKCYMLSVRSAQITQGTIAHLKMKIDNKKEVYELESTRKTFPSMDELLTYYETNPLNEKIRRIGQPCMIPEEQEKKDREEMEAKIKLEKMEEEQKEQKERHEREKQEIYKWQQQLQVEHEQKLQQQQQMMQSMMEQQKDTQKQMEEMKRYMQKEMADQKQDLVEQKVEIARQQNLIAEQEVELARQKAAMAAEKKVADEPKAQAQDDSASNTAGKSSCVIL